MQYLILLFYPLYYANHPLKDFFNGIWFFGWLIGLTIAYGLWPVSLIFIIAFYTAVAFSGDKS